MDILDFLTNLTFPAGVAAYALWNSYKHEQFLQDSLKQALEENTKALNDLKMTCAKIVGIKSHGKDEEN